MENIWENAYKMKCGEVKQLFPNNNSVERLSRVPGGWIYCYGDLQGTTSTFVPFDNEFQGLFNKLTEE